MLCPCPSQKQISLWHQPPTSLGAEELPCSQLEAVAVQGEAQPQQGALGCSSCVHCELDATFHGINRKRTQLHNHIYSILNTTVKKKKGGKTMQFATAFNVYFSSVAQECQHYWDWTERLFKIGYHADLYLWLEKISQWEYVLFRFSFLLCFQCTFVTCL